MTHQTNKMKASLTRYGFYEKEEKEETDKESSDSDNNDN